MMSGRNWVQDIRDDLEYQRSHKEIYFKAMITAVGMLFDSGHPEKGKAIMKMAGLPIGKGDAPAGSAQMTPARGDLGSRNRVSGGT